MKRTFISVALWILLLLLIPSVCLSIAFLAYTHIHRRAYCAEYNTYAAEFHIVKDYLIAQYPAAEDKCFLVSVSEDGKRRLFDLASQVYLTCPSEVTAALDTIDQLAFSNKDSDFDTIRMDGERVSFCIVNGQYSLTYSPNGKPSFVNSQEETNNVFVKSIRDGWYHVVKDPDS